jgi:predicted transcriptional regulator
MARLRQQENGLTTLQRSKLELHIDILRALACYGKLKLTHVMYKANVNCSVLKQCLDFLIQQNLVEEQTLVKRRRKTLVVYAITERGLTALKCFREVSTALQLVVDVHKIPVLLY